MKLLLIGPPGSGKGTQGVRLSEKFGTEHIAAGLAPKSRCNGRRLRTPLRATGCTAIRNCLLDNLVGA